MTFLAGADTKPTAVALDAAFLRRNPVHSFTAGGSMYVALTSEGGANRIYRAGETRFVRASDAEVFDDQGRAWLLDEDQLSGPNGEARPREPARRTFWFAWVAQFPNTIVIK